MDCNEYKNLITEYLENTASPSQRIQMESHLSECGRCRTLAEQEKAVMEQLNTIPTEPCPDEIIDQVMKSISIPSMSLKGRIRKWLQPKRPMHFGFASLAGFFAVVVFLLLICLPGQQKHTLEVQKFSPEEIRQATVETKLALAYFAVYSRKTEAILENINFNDPVLEPIEGELTKALGKIPYI